jgi:predicted RecA/RadA family phage recombinase
MEQVNLTTEQVVLAERDTVEQVTISETETVVVESDSAVTIVTGMIGPKGADGIVLGISSIPDVDASNLQEGSMLVYSTSASKWQATTTLSNQTLEAGQF